MYLSIKGVMSAWKVIPGYVRIVHTIVGSNTSAQEIISQKKFLQSTHLPQLRLNTLIEFCTRNTSHNGTKLPCAHWYKI